MSYSATISFKKIRPGEIFDFFLKIKEKVKENLEKIAEDDFIFSPYAKNTKKYSDSKYDFGFINDNVEWPKEFLLIGIFIIKN